MITPGGHITTMESHLQGCATSNAVRREGVVFREHPKSRRERRSRDRTRDQAIVESEGSNNMNKVNETDET